MLSILIYRKGGDLVMSKEIISKFSRREFLKLGGISLASGLLTGCGINEDKKPIESTKTPTPKAIFTPTKENMLPTARPTEAKKIATTTPTVESTPESQVVENYWQNPYPNPAPKEGDLWSLHNSDGVEVLVDLHSALGFTPDADLRVSDIKPVKLNPVPSDASDFQAYLNTERNGFPPLAGYTDGINDYGQFGASNPQIPIYSWMVFTGENIELPGIGRVEGGKGRAVMVLIINRTERVFRFPEESVHVEAGFQGWGRIWNGEPNFVQETEKRLVNHYRTRLGQGVPETGFIGQCDEVDNCDKVTVVTVERMQWGYNPDGSPRDQFRLIRAKTVNTVS
ncbi:MAG: hypothetical protein KatS3mg089_0929 [Patescibacteria group bacterium]|nr:MAG: hypothetical protein KatS3mg089_0929 [Patescibacteria group bacterium]